VKFGRVVWINSKMSEEQPFPHFGCLQKGTLIGKEEHVPDNGNGLVFENCEEWNGILKKP